MDFLNIRTSYGPLGFVGQIHMDLRRPCLLAVSGAFPSEDYLHDLVNYFRGVNVLVANLPGMSGVPWHTTTPEDLTKGLEEAVGLLLRDLPIVAFGASTGNLLALGLRLPNICRRVALEPFFQTKDLWPFIKNARERLELNKDAPTGPPVTQFLWDYFGVAPDRLENRDYRHLLQNITVPMDVVVGQLPLLPERKLDRWPSFTSDEERAALTANPLVTLHEGRVGSGHGVHLDALGDADVKRLIHQALRAASELC